MSDDQFTKLSKKLDIHFGKIDQKLTNHDQSFEKFLKYMGKRFDGIDKKFEANHHQHADILAAVAELGGQLKDYHVELLLLSKKVDRLEQAVLHIAQETGVKLKFDF